MASPPASCLQSVVPGAGTSDASQMTQRRRPLPGAHIQSVVPTAAASEKPQLSQRRHFPCAAGARSTDDGHSRGVARDRGLLERPPRSPVLGTRSTIPSVIPPWVAKEETTCCVASDLPSCSRQSTGSRNLDATAMGSSRPATHIAASEKLQARQAWHLFGVADLSVTCSKGSGEPPIDQLSFSSTFAPPPRVLGSCRSLPPDAFRFEGAPTRVAMAKPRVHNKDVPSSLTPEGEPTKTPASTPSAAANSSRATMRFGQRGKILGARMTCHDLRAWVASGATAAAPAHSRSTLR